jgi:hypothetical protein
MQWAGRGLLLAYRRTEELCPRQHRGAFVSYGHSPPPLASPASNPTAGAVFLISAREDASSRDAMLAAEIAAHVAFVRAWAGEKAAAVAEYGRLLRTPWGNMAANSPDTGFNVMKRDPRYRPLRGEPRFEALRNKPQTNAPLF